MYLAARCSACGGAIQLVGDVSKRAASEEMPLRQIFDDVCRSTGVGSEDVPIASVDSLMYKRRRIALRTRTVVTQQLPAADSFS